MFTNVLTHGSTKYKNRCIYQGCVCVITADKYTTAKRHHSGHFRHATAEVWDPHPQYEFTAFGRRFRLRLAHDSSFVSPNIMVR